MLLAMTTRVEQNARPFSGRRCGAAEWGQIKNEPVFASAWLGCGPATRTECPSTRTEFRSPRVRPGLPESSRSIRFRAPRMMRLSSHH